LPRSNWQVPWLEHYLTEAGTAPVDPDEPHLQPPCSSVRIAFFVHYLDVNLPLQTPAGPISLPAESPRPARLAFVEYEPVD